MTHPARRPRGFTLLEVLIGLVLMALGIILLNSLMADNAERSRETLAAQHMVLVDNAARQYIKDNNATLLSTATASTPVVVTVPILQTAGYLAAGVTAANPYGQTYDIRVLQPTAGLLSTLVITNGGETISEGSLRHIARQVGAEGGYVSSASSTLASGAYGGWSQTLTTYGAANGAGRLAASLFFKNGEQVTDFLYRATVVGHPELNQMAAPIDMVNNNINNAGTVTAQAVTSSGRVTASEYIQLGTAVTPGTSCAVIGLLAHDATGRLASCVSGSWVGY